MKTAPAKKVKKVVAKKAPARRKITPVPKKLTEVLADPIDLWDSSDYYGNDTSVIGRINTARRAIGNPPIISKTPPSGWDRLSAMAEYTAEMIPRKVGYLAGPMRNLPNFGFDIFHAAAKYLSDEVKIDVWSPAAHDLENGFDPTLNSLDGFDLKAAMRWDLGCVLKADMVIVLPGWEASAGCNVEVSMAREIGTPVLSYPSLEPVAPESICAEADRIVSGARGTVYNHPYENFISAADLWAPIIGQTLTPEQVALCMIQLKISRLTHSPDHRDTIVDIAGYAKTYDLVRQRRTEMAVA